MESQETSQPWLRTIFGLLTLVVGAFAALLVIQEDSFIKLLVLIAGLGVVLITFLKAEIGLLVLIFITYTRFSDVAIKYHGAPSVAKFFVGVVIMAILSQWILDGKQPQGWERSTMMVALYGIVGFTSLLYASDIHRAQDALSDFIKDALITIVITALISRVTILRWVVWTLLGAGLFLGSLSVFQYITGTFQNNYGGFAQAAVMQIVGTASDDYRIAGPFGSPNAYAQVMVVLVPLAIDRLVSERNPWAKAIAGWALAASALTVIFTFSRGGFLALIMVTMLIMWRQRPPIMAVLVVLAIGIALLPLLPAQYTARLGTLLDFLPTNQTSSQNDVSFRGRTNEYAVGLLMFRDNPILGVGMENYPTEYLRYSRLVGLDPRRENRSPHSLYVEIAAERGIVGLSVFAFLIGVVFYSIGKAREMLTSAHQPGSASLVIAVGVGLAGYLTSALFIHASYPRHFWLLIGVALALPRMAQNELQEFRALKAWLQKRNKKASQLRSRRPPTDLGGVKLT